MVENEVESLQLAQHLDWDNETQAYVCCGLQGLSSRYHAQTRNLDDLPFSKPMA